MSGFTVNYKTRMKIVNFLKKHRFLVFIIICSLYYFFSRLFTSLVVDSNSAASGGAFVESNSLETVSYAHHFSSKSANCKSGIHGMDSGCRKDLDRVLDYCAADIIDDPIYLASDDVEDTESDMKLVHLLFTIRHGDRTAINKIKGSLVYREPIDVFKDKIKLIRPEARRHLLKLLHFTIRDDKNSTQYFPYINTSFVFRVSDGYLAPGMLTSLGFLQHVKLGEKLNKMYSKFLLREVVHPNEVYIRSTNYPRTIQSAAAFTSNLLPHTGGPEGRFIINTLVNEDDEVMHGVGLKLSSSHVSALDGSSAGGDEIRSGPCERAYALAHQEAMGFKPSEVAMGGAASLFGDKVYTQSITEVADSVMPNICHQTPLPCLYEDPNKCMKPELVASIMDDADRHFCDRYFGSNGGYEATKLSMYPLLTEILGKLDEAKKSYLNSINANNMNNAMKGENSERSSPKVNVLSGHDTVIAPIIATLVGQDVRKIIPKLCNWPNYASVIAFELWTDLKASSISKDTSSSHDGNFHVQILYNGESMCQYIPECSAGKQQKRKIGASGSSATRAGKLRTCSLADLRKRIRSLLGGADSLEQACKVPKS